MGKKVKRHKCKYCGTASHCQMCNNCKLKLSLVRDLLAMVKNKAKECGKL